MTSTSRPDPYANLTPRSSAMAVARAICAMLLTPRYGPHVHGALYRLSIDHDVSAVGCRPRKDGTHKPKTGACPLHYYWQHARIVGIETPIRRVAELWIMEALAAGYEVSRLPNRRGSYDVNDCDSVASVQAAIIRREERKNRPRAALSLDDEIPF